ncbi:PREDICTED: Ig mu heavy chain disease protein-like [Nanorana parkeri]|uniref:Ig mu heavy chain disease protein-like n=1 Tax=Nanorana parkeri TaxID=125878 RepID=UPI000854E6B2|nr:PREDICTED: Ig mu heavy chain disease protein-like [Nanorana parkeri]
MLPFSMFIFPAGRVIRSLCDSGEVRYSLTLEGFYPGYLHFKWTCGETEDTDIISSQEHYTDNNNLFTVCSEVIIPQTDLTCSGSTVNVHWEHEYTDSTGREKMCIRDSDFPWRPAVEEVQVPRLFHDTLVTLQCDISGYYPDAVSVTWLRKNKENQEICEDSASIPQTSSHKTTDNTYSCTARLTITPTLRVHQGAEYICRVQHPSLQKAIEKSTGRLNMIGRPQMDPIQMTLVDNMFIQFCLTLKRFYPKDFKIKWYREERQPREGVRQGTKHTETITEDDDLTFCVTSECQVWGSSFADPQYKLYVTWEHASLDGPETRTLSVRDFPWSPMLGKINVPTLEDNQKSALRCHITGYFPNVITVAWFKRERGKVSAAPVSSNMAAEILPHKDIKALFACTAILYFTPTIEEDQGSEFICRVEHPSLEQPREISTGPLEISTLF